MHRLIPNRPSSVADTADKIAPLLHMIWIIGPERFGQALVLVSPSTLLYYHIVENRELEHQSDSTSALPGLGDHLTTSDRGARGL